MNHETIAQVDPIALRQKLLKLGIGAKFPLSPTFAENAVAEAFRAQGVKASPSTPDAALALSPAELAYCVDAWSRLWEVPA